MGRRTAGPLHVKWPAYPYYISLRSVRIAILVSEPLLLLGRIMDSLRTFYDHHSFVLWLVMLVLLVMVALWTLALQRHTRRLDGRLSDIFSGVSSENMGRMLAEYLSTVRRTATAVDQMKAEHDELATLMPQVIRHVGLVRFSPFHDTGGDQSFALALLDGSGDGVVITALHSRSDSRLYAKPIDRGTSAYALTPEEKEAMDRAFGRTPAGISI